MTVADPGVPAQDDLFPATDAAGDVWNAPLAGPVVLPLPASEDAPGQAPQAGTTALRGLLDLPDDLWERTEVAAADLPTDLPSPAFVAPAAPVGTRAPRGWAHRRRAPERRTRRAAALVAVASGVATAGLALLVPAGPDADAPRRLEAAETGSATDTRPTTATTPARAAPPSTLPGPDVDPVPAATAEAPAPATPSPDPSATSTPATSRATTSVAPTRSNGAPAPTPTPSPAAVDVTQPTAVPATVAPADTTPVFTAPDAPPTTRRDRQVPDTTVTTATTPPSVTTTSLAGGICLGESLRPVPCE